MAHGGKRAGSGRPKTVKPVYTPVAPKEIDYNEVERLASMYCTQEEIGHWFNLSVDTLDRLSKEDPKFNEFYERGKAKGRISFRRQQIQLLQAGNATMAVWLGKQILGQRDQLDHRHSGPGGGAIPLTLQAFDGVTDDEDPEE